MMINHSEGLGGRPKKKHTELLRIFNLYLRVCSIEAVDVNASYEDLTIDRGLWGFCM